jgi:hypothetical protein
LFRSAAIIGALFFLSLIAHAQTFQILYNFTGGRDGANPLGGLTAGANGNLYGTASAGANQVYGCNNNVYGNTGCGSVFELARSGSGWILRPLYDFQGGSDSGNPSNIVTFGPDGALYSTAGGLNCANFNVCGDVFRLAPPPNICNSFLCYWQETVLYTFTGQPDGSYPTSSVLFDASGNMYGLTFFGGAANIGALYKLAKSGGGWNESVPYSFVEHNLSYGVYFPGGQWAIDSSGNLYGTAACSTTLSCFYGAVFQLQPGQSGWTLNELYDFTGNNGYDPQGVIRDSSGNLYGATSGADGGGNDSAGIYELSPSNGGWNFTQLYNYGGFGEDNTANLVRDSAGNLYGTNSITGYGSVFKLSPSNGGWTFTTLYTFTGGSDGEGPGGQLVLDSAGNLYGVAWKGGKYGQGVIWEITP